MSAPRREKSLYVTPCCGRVAPVSRACRELVATCRDMSRACRGHVAPCRERVTPCRGHVAS
eukprot:1078527-Prymnesium_polylepis.1